MGDATTISFVDDVTGYAMPKVFVDHLSVLFGGMLGVIKYMGRPISQPYWIKVHKGTIERTILYMLTERGDITYDPDNSDPYKVELGLSGNIFGKIMLGGLDTKVQPEYFDGNRFISTINVKDGAYSLTFMSDAASSFRITVNDPALIVQAGQIMIQEGVLPQEGAIIYIASSQANAIKESHKKASDFVDLMMIDKNGAYFPYLHAPTNSGGPSTQAVCYFDVPDVISYQGDWVETRSLVDAEATNIFFGLEKVHEALNSGDTNTPFDLVRMALIKGTTAERN